MYKPLITDGSKKFGNNRWLSYSSKLKRDVYLFSDLEYEHWLLVESDPKIVEFCEQALLMESFINGKIDYMKNIIKDINNQKVCPINKSTQYSSYRSLIQIAMDNMDSRRY